MIKHERIAEPSAVLWSFYKMSFRGYIQSAVKRSLKIRKNGRNLRPEKSFHVAVDLCFLNNNNYNNIIIIIIIIILSNSFSFWLIKKNVDVALFLIKIWGNREKQ